MIVLDASAAVDLLLGRAGARRTAGTIAAERAVHAPHLLDTEVLSALRRWVRRGRLAPGRAAEALADLADLPLVRHPHAPLTPRVWSLRHRLSPYHATYLALAEALEATLVTADRGLARVSHPLVETVVSL